METEFKKERNAIPAICSDGLTEDQRAAVETDGKVLVAASAGSGKTSTLLKKILREIGKGVSLDRMLVLVYNVAAAEELKERLHGELFAAACSSDGEARERFRRNLDMLAFANIGTIHSFCRSLIRENFEKLGLSPTFDVLDARRNEYYKSRAMDAVFDEVASDDPEFYTVADILSKRRSEESLRGIVSYIHSVYEIQPDKAKFRENVAASFSDPEHGVFAQTLVRRAHGIFRACLKGCDDVMPPLAATGQASYCAMTKRIAQICREGLASDFKGILNMTRQGADLPSAHKTKNADENAVAYAAKIKKTVLGLFSDWNARFGDDERLYGDYEQNARLAGKLMDIVVRFDEKLSEIKLADDVLSFTDLETYAAALVGGGDYRNLFDIVFVDEYQDVNPVQEYIIAGLTGDNAFMVGDVKQSIYGFRLSDPGIFLKRKDDYENGGGKSIGFRKNFRSGSAVLRFVNAVFDVVMTEESADVDYAEDGHFEVDSERDGGAKNGGAQSRGDCGVQVHLFGINARNAATKYGEGRFIAGEIKRLVGRAKSGGGKLTYGDCVLLFRNRSSAKRVLQCLREEGIPVDDGDFRKEKTKPERDLINFLTVLDNPRQDLPLAGFLLSYFGGYEEEEVAAIAANRGKDDDLYDALLKTAESGDDLGKKVVQTLSVLEGYRLKASFKSVPELMQSIVSDFGFDAYMAVKGEGMASALIAFVTATAGKDTVAGISKFLAAYNSVEEDLPRASTGGDRVRVATFHSFKGLEAPVVFVACAGDKWNGGGNDDKDIVADNSGYIGLYSFDVARRTKRNTLSRFAVETMIEERETKEEMRLLYVALTRAKQYLYVTASCAREVMAEFGKIPLLSVAERYTDYISEAVYRGSLCAPVFVHPETETEVIQPQKRFRPLTVTRDCDIRAVREAAAFVYPHEVSTGLSMKYSVSALDGGADEFAMSAFADRADEGTAYHRLMELIDYEKTGVEGVKEEFARILSEGLMSEEELSVIDPVAVARCLDSPLMALARKSRCYREKSFLMYVPAEEVGQGDSDDKVLVQGVVDLIIDGEKKIIVDFKNSLLKSREALEKYKKQLYLYKKAVESGFLAKIDSIVLYSFKTGKTVEM